MSQRHHELEENKKDAEEKTPLLQSLNKNNVAGPRNRRTRVSNTLIGDEELPSQRNTHQRKFICYVMKDLFLSLSRRLRRKKMQQSDLELNRNCKLVDYYRDDYNDLSYSCKFGTKDENNGIWMNLNDPGGLILSSFVWIFTIYSTFTVVLLAEERKEPPLVAIVYCTLCVLSLACHAKTTLTDPGSVPESAIPIHQTDGNQIDGNKSHNMCSQCQVFKPPFSHHCRICDRCISRMDHHCPWMNNWCRKYEAFYTFLTLYMVSIIFCFTIFCMALFLMYKLHKKLLYFFAYFNAFSTNHDNNMYWFSVIYHSYVDECYLWINDRNWDN